MDICVVTVTYGSRAYYVERLIDACIEAGAREVFIFDNGSAEASSQCLRDKVASDEEVFLLRAEENLGSAGGFKSALEWARTNALSEFIWILDDDNIPDRTALDSLWNAYKYLGGIASNVLVSYRMMKDKTSGKLVHKRELWDSVTKGKDVGKPGSLISRFFQKLGKLVTKKKTVVNYPIVRRTRASWGGLFLHKSVLDEVGYPNQDFYLYGDDFEFSDRLYASGYSVFTVFRSRIVDIDYQHDSGGLFSENQPEFKAYYSLRNHVFLDFKGKLFSCILLIFGLIFVGFVRAGFSRFFLSRSFLVVRAVKDGFFGNLGHRSVSKVKV